MTSLASNRHTLMAAIQRAGMLLLVRPREGHPAEPFSNALEKPGHKSKGGHYYEKFE